MAAEFENLNLHGLSATQSLIFWFVLTTFGKVLATGTICFGLHLFLFSGSFDSGGYFSDSGAQLLFGFFALLFLVSGSVFSILGFASEATLALCRFLLSQYSFFLEGIESFATGLAVFSPPLDSVLWFWQRAQVLSPLLSGRRILPVSPLFAGFLVLFGMLLLLVGCDGDCRPILMGLVPYHPVGLLVPYHYVGLAPGCDDGAAFSIIDEGDSTRAAFPSALVADETFVFHFDNTVPTIPLRGYAAFAESLQAHSGLAVTCGDGSSREQFSNVVAHSGYKFDFKVLQNGVNLVSHFDNTVPTIPLRGYAAFAESLQARSGLAVTCGDGSSREQCSNVVDNSGDKFVIKAQQKGVKQLSHVEKTVPTITLRGYAAFSESLQAR
jgi:hypothetical protein